MSCLEYHCHNVRGCRHVAYAGSFVSIPGFVECVCVSATLRPFCALWVGFFQRFRHSGHSTSHPWTRTAGEFREPLATLLRSVPTAHEPRREPFYLDDLAKEKAHRLAYAQPTSVQYRCGTLFQVHIDTAPDVGVFQYCCHGVTFKFCSNNVATKQSVEQIVRASTQARLHFVYLPTKASCNSATVAK